MEAVTLIDACQIPVAATLRDAMLALERGSREVVLVIDETKRLVGLLTDGDVRRALLAGATLADPVMPHMKRGFTFVGPATGRAEVLDLMQARRIGQIPVVDGDGRLVGLHLLHDVIGAPERESWAVVMAGGRGARLAPLTDNVPKPMIRVAGRPILERIVLHLVGSGFRRVFLSVNYLAGIIEEHFGDGARFGCRIDYLREERPLGTGGALALLPEPPTRPLLVMNGDLVTQADLGAMIDFHERGRQAITVGVRRYLHTVPFGCVELSGERIVQFHEKPTLARLVNAGIYVFTPSLLARVDRGVEYPITNLLEESLRRGEEIAAFEIEDDWIDVGQREQLRRARERT